MVHMVNKSNVSDVRCHLPKIKCINHFGTEVVQNSGSSSEIPPSHCPTTNKKKIPLAREMSSSMTNPQVAVHNVFVYGSLLADDVVRALLKRVPQNSPATLNNYRRFSIKGRIYPAILPVESNKVVGRILCGITDPELNILDIFEDEEYERKEVEVALKDGAEKSEAYTYVWVNKTDPDLYGEWNFEEWKQLHMEDFMKMTMNFVEELELPDSETRVPT